MIIKKRDNEKAFENDKYGIFETKDFTAIE
jgi:hypothetical protein